MSSIQDSIQTKTHARWKSPDIEVTLSDEQIVPLSSLHEVEPLLLVFLRHLGCPFCREQVSSLTIHPHWNVVFVTMGTPPQAAEFREKMQSPHKFIADNARLLYKAFGLGKGEGKQVMSPRIFAKGFGATLRGHWVGKAIGDPWQMPGIFKIDPDGMVAWEYRSLDSADYPEVEQLASALNVEY